MYREGGCVSSTILVREGGWVSITGYVWKGRWVSSTVLSKSHKVCIFGNISRFLQWSTLHNLDLLLCNLKLQIFYHSLSHFLSNITYNKILL